MHDEAESKCPTDPASRALVEQDNTVNRDRDYGRINHGITVVVL